MAADGCVDEPKQKRSKFSLEKCPRPRQPKGSPPDLSQMSSEAKPLPAPLTVRNILSDATRFLAIDTETHALVPAGNSKREVGEFGFPTRASDETLSYLRLLQLGWARSQDGADPVVKTRLIRPVGFAVQAEAAEKHKITHEHASAHGVPVKEALAELFEDVSAAVEQGCRICAHHCGFDAGIIGREMQRAGLLECKAAWDGMVSKHGLCTMEPSICHWVRCQTGTSPDMPRNVAMGLKDMAALLLPDRARQLLANHHDAGTDAHLALLIAEELARRARL